MSDEKSKALHESMTEIRAEWLARRKAQLKEMHASGKYVSGKKDPGKTIAQTKKDRKEAWKNRHNDPTYKGNAPAYSTATESTPKITQYIKTKDYNKDYDKMGKGDWHEPADKRRKADPYRSEPY